jgi:protein-S-isoprenylcysteine O-methyltransferase Ste14
MLMMWPGIPMVLIQLHSFPNFWRKLGVWTYLVWLLEWLPIAYVINSFQSVLLQNEIAFHPAVIALGVSCIIAGILLHSWTAKLLGIKSTVGYTELKPEREKSNGGLITSGPFSVVRHPSYGAHSLILVGTFLITGITAVGIMAIIDLLIAYFVTMELEERELLERFGDQYREYRMKVPKFFPRIG